jgi:hypothetical protein
MTTRDDDSTAETSLGLILPPHRRRSQPQAPDVNRTDSGVSFHTPAFRARLADYQEEDDKDGDSAGAEEVALRSVVTTEAESQMIAEEKQLMKAREENREREIGAALERDRIAKQQELEGPLEAPQKKRSKKKKVVEEEEEEEDEDELEPSRLGTILEAAFVDPAYSWPPADGAGRNAIELQASIDLLQGDNISVGTTESMRERMTPPDRPVIVPSKKWWQCCKKDDAAVAQIRDYEQRKMAAKEARKAYAHLKKEKKKQQELARRMQTKYNRIPEGILIYRLDTSKKRLLLMSPPHTNTNLSTLVVEMTVVSAYPSTDKSRRGIILQGADGQEAMLTACEQRTAVSWLEAINIMTAKAEHNQKGFSSLLKVRG